MHSTHQMTQTEAPMSARPLTLARSLVLVTAGAALAGCGLLGPGSVPAADVEEQVTSELTELVGQAPDDVSCPEDLPAEEGAAITCVLSAGGETIDVEVTAASVDGSDVQLDIQVADAVNE